MSLSDISEQIYSTEYRDDEGSYHHHERVVVARLNDGSEENLFDALTDVINFWILELNKRALIGRYPVYLKDVPSEPRARSECVQELPMEIVQGLPASMRFYPRRFNYISGLIESINLEGAEASFSAYPAPPPWEFVLSLTNDATEEAFERTVRLTAEESTIFEAFTTDSERRAFVEALPCAKAALEEIVVEAERRLDGK